MANIEWNEEKFDIETFIQFWKEYINENASWFQSIESEYKEDPKFHEELALKINDTIEKIVSEAPTKEQIEELDQLMKEKNIEIDYSCKMEANYHLKKLK